MSEPSTPSALIPHDPHRHQSTPAQPLAVQQPTSTSTPSSPTPSALARDYRKGNWTLHETLILITAKRLDDERRTSRPGAATPRSAELRWKWVENYCWNNGCHRSQNQCNDKWDNLLRDYKKVRDYESRSAGSAPSYWAMEKHDRKDRNLPSNLSSEVYEALTDVLTRRNANRAATPVSSRSPPPLPPQPPPPPPAIPAAAASASLPLRDDAPGASEGTTGSEQSGSEAKRRRVRGVGQSVTRGASVLARTLLACEERRDKRHRDMMELEERRLRMEDERTEVSRQGMSGLIAAVNGLSGAIHALVADHHQNVSGGASR